MALECSDFDLSKAAGSGKPAVVATLFAGKGATVESPVTGKAFSATPGSLLLSEHTLPDGHHLLPPLLPSEAVGEQRAAAPAARAELLDALDDWLWRGGTDGGPGRAGGVDGRGGAVAR